MSSSSSANFLSSSPRSSRSGGRRHARTTITTNLILITTVATGLLILIQLVSVSNCAANEEETSFTFKNLLDGGNGGLNNNITAGTRIGGDGTQTNEQQEQQQHVLGPGAGSIKVPHQQAEQHNRDHGGYKKMENNLIDNMDKHKEQQLISKPPELTNAQISNSNPIPWNNGSNNDYQHKVLGKDDSNNDGELADDHVMNEMKMIKNPPSKSISGTTTTTDVNNYSNNSSSINGTLKGKSRTSRTTSHHSRQHEEHDDGEGHEEEDDYDYSDEEEDEASDKTSGSNSPTHHHQQQQKEHGQHHHNHQPRPQRQHHQTKHQHYYDYHNFSADDDEDDNADNNKEHPGHESNQQPSSLSKNSKVCGKLALQECINQLPPHPDIGIPATQQGVLNACRAFHNGMECVSNWTKHCLNETQRKQLTMSIIGAHETFTFLCQDEKFRTDYLHHASCYNKISKHWDNCAKKFITALKQLKNAETSTELCCMRIAFLQCVMVVTNRYCDKNATQFLQLMGETLIRSTLYGHTPPHCAKVTAAHCPLLQTSAATSITIHHLDFRIQRFDLILVNGFFSWGMTLMMTVVMNRVNF